ncbi:MAG: AsmA-like C-terminal region-containing protein, partial [Mucilaginibacter sp.]
VDNCEFDGAFTNNYVKGKGLGDENSAIKIYNFKGNYQQIPFSIDTGIIQNLISPIAAGTFKSKFQLAKLNPIFGGEPIKFSNGTANLNLKYKADIVDFQLHKPMLAGIISVNNADMTYVPRNLELKNTSLALNFKGDDLLLNNIRLQSGHSVVLMNGRVNNFLNLYYNAPEKILLTWNIHSPQMYLGEFLGILNARTNSKTVRSSGKKTNFANQLNIAFEKGSAQMHLRADKVYYRKFLATAATADVLFGNNGLTLKNVSVKHAGGSLKLNGRIVQKGKYNSFAVNSVVSNVDISHFMYAFSNFGLSSLTSENLRGFLSSRANVTGSIANTGDLVPRSVNGTVSINLKKGALLSFAPIKSIGKFAFPFRDLDNITFSNLDGQFDLKGEKIIIHPMQINSSLLNLDMSGIYSLTTGTNIALDVPLRNPKKDAEITDKEERDSKRMRGIVIHLVAVDGDDGKVKIKLNRNRKKDDDKI